MTINKITAEKAAFLIIQSWVEEKPERKEERILDLADRAHILEKKGQWKLFIGYCFCAGFKQEEKRIIILLKTLTDKGTKIELDNKFNVKDVEKELELWFKYWENTKRYLERGYVDYSRES